MAIGATTVWEVRTTGNAANGGGYSSGGTDYSQQDAAQLTLTDGATSGAGVTTLTSVTGGFTSAMVGNVLYISSGTNFQTGYYQITVYTDTNTVTLDRTPSSGAAGSGGNFKVGGAVTLPSLIQAAVVRGNTVYIKNGTYTDNLVPTATGDGLNINWIGYNSSRDDNPLTTSRPTIKPSSGVAINVGSAVEGHIFRYLILDGTGGGTSGVQTTTASGCWAVFHHVKATGFSSHGFILMNSIAYFCESSSNSTGFSANGAAAGFSCFYCYAHDNTNQGYVGTNQYGPACISCIADTNGATGFISPARNGMLMLGCIAYNNTGATTDGFAITGTQVDGAGQFLNNIAMSNGRYGFSRTGTSNTPASIFDYNCYNNNSTAGLNNITAGAHDVTSSPSFTDAPNGDFTLSAGSPCIDTGTPTGSMAGATV